jgi:hypothetical protein
MRTLILTLTACAGMACAMPAGAAVVVPAVMTGPVAAPDTVGASPLLQKVWWDRWHHWHHRHWHHHHWHPRPY